jgi:hypothetical protein
MKINEILLEAPVEPYSVRQPGTEEVIEILRTKCSEFMDNNYSTPLYRGSRGAYNDAVLVDPSKGVRKSQNLSNHYTELMDNSPYMKNYPKRSNSLICTTSSSRAMQYGRVFVVIPFNGTELGIARDSDIWQTSVYLEKLNWDTNFYKLANELKRMGFPDNFNDMVWYGESSTFSHIFSREFYDEKDDFNSKDFIDYLQYEMSPDRVGFSLEDTSSFSSVEYPNRECWFSNPCLMIEESFYDSIVEEIINSY